MKTFEENLIEDQEVVETLSNSIVQDFGDSETMVMSQNAFSATAGPVQDIVDKLIAGEYLTDPRILMLINETSANEELLVEALKDKGLDVPDNVSAAEIAQIIRDALANNEELLERDQTISQLEQDRSDQDGIIEELIQRVTDRDGSIDELNGQITEKDTAIAEKNTQLEEQTVQITTLSNEVSEKNGQIASLSAEVEEKTGTISTLNSQVTTLQATNTELSTEVEQLRVAHAECDLTIEQLRQQIASSDHSACQEQIQELQNQLDEAQAAHADYENTIESLSAQLESAQAAHTDCANTIASLTAQIEELQNQSGTATPEEIEQLNNQISELQGQLEAAQAAHTDCESTISGLQSQLEAAQAAHADCESTITDLNAQIEELQNQNPASNVCIEMVTFEDFIPTGEPFVCSNVDTDQLHPQCVTTGTWKKIHGTWQQDDWVEGGEWQPGDDLKNFGIEFAGIRIEGITVYEDQFVYGKYVFITSAYSGYQGDGAYNFYTSNLDNDAEPPYEYGIKLKNVTWTRVSPYTYRGSNVLTDICTGLLCETNVSTYGYTSEITIKYRPNYHYDDWNSRPYGPNRFIELTNKTRSGLTFNVPNNFRKNVNAKYMYEQPINHKFKLLETDKIEPVALICMNNHRNCDITEALIANSKIYYPTRNGEVYIANMLPSTIQFAAIYNRK